MEDAESYLRRIATRLTHAGVNAQAVTAYGEPADVIESQTQSTDADLIAMATHGRWGVDRLLHGSLAELVLAQQPRPLLLFGPDASVTRPISRILIPLDGGPFSAEILPEVARFVRSFLIEEIDLLGVVPPQLVHLDETDGATPGWALQRMGLTSIGSGSFALNSNHPAVQHQIQEMEHALDYWSDWLGGIGAKAQTYVRYDLDMDNIARSTLAAADALQADMILMRTHARRGLARTLVGSVADDVVRNSRVPVLLYSTAALEAVAASQGGVAVTARPT
jgi:nucleotide-binding universal stress UspA family protein